ncbi:MAG: hypothetical protein ACFFCD_00675 [Promethearchaeota archaeon]
MMRTFIRKIGYDYMLFLSVLVYDLLFLKDLIHNSKRYRRTVISLFAVCLMTFLTLIYAILEVFTVALRNSLLILVGYIAILSLFLAATWRSRIRIALPIKKPVGSTSLFFHPTSESPIHSLFFMQQLLETAQKARLNGDLKKTWKVLKHFQSVWNEVLIQKIKYVLHR